MVTTPRTRPPRGFTLVEVLVVIAILALLMGIMLPGIQYARESARRITCGNNQRNVATAAFRFDDSSGYLPGWRNQITTTITSTSSWPVPLLPNLERKDVWTAATGSAAFTAPYLSFFVCPSSPPNVSTTPALSYAGSAGNNNRNDGVMVDATNSANRVTVDGVSDADGTSMTLILAEKCFTGGTTAFTQTVWSLRNTQVPAAFTFGGSGTALPVFGLTTTSNSPVINPTNFAAPGTTTPSLASLPSSNHQGGVVAAFVDGHVVFLKDSIAMGVYAQLLSWNTASSSTTSTVTWGAAAYGASGATPLSEADFQ